MTMPAQKPGKSKQNYGTPPEFLDAVRTRLHIEQFTLDVAAEEHNAVCPFYYTKDDDAIAMPWCPTGWNWCNPPFAHIHPWVQTAYEQAIDNECDTAVLIPASVGANWWRDWVHEKATVLFLNGRITFVGETLPYIKDCALLLYGPHMQGSYDVWSWRE